MMTSSAFGTTCARWCELVPRSWLAPAGAHWRKNLATLPGNRSLSETYPTRARSGSCSRPVISKAGSLTSVLAAPCQQFVTVLSNRVERPACNVSYTTTAWTTRFLGAELWFLGQASRTAEPWRAVRSLLAYRRDRQRRYLRWCSSRSGSILSRVTRVQAST